MVRRDLNGKKPWTSEEDEKLRSYVQEHGFRGWKTVAQKLGKSGNSCRLRWYNYLSPEIIRGNITDKEWISILKLHSELGNKWSRIAQHFPGRTDNEIKNFWNTRVKKEAKLLGLDANSREFRERMTEILTARIQMAAVLVDVKVPSPTTAAENAYLLSPLPAPADEGGSGGDFSTGPTFGYYNIDGAGLYSYNGSWSAQQLGNHEDLAYSFPPHPPAVAGGSGGSTASTGSTVGLSTIDGADLYSYESWSASDHAHLSSPPPLPAVAGGSGGNNTASTGHTTGQPDTGTEDCFGDFLSNYFDF